MRKITTVILLLCIMLSCSTKKDSKIKLEKDYHRFVGKTIDNYLQQNIGYKSLQIIDRKPGSASSLLIEYPLDSITIELFPDKFRFMKQFDEKGQWDIKLFKKETIAIIRVIKNDSVVDVIPNKKDNFNPID